MYKAKNGPGYIRIPVGPGQDGQVWSVYNIACNGLSLLSVPPCIALGRDELLVPREALAKQHARRGTALPCPCRGGGGSSAAFRRRTVLLSSGGMPADEADEAEGMALRCCAVRGNLSVGTDWVMEYPPWVYRGFLGLIVKNCCFGWEWK